MKIIEQLISLKTASLASKKGFDRFEIQEPFLNEEGDVHYPGITQSFLQKWLRDIHKLHLHICFMDEVNYWIVDVYDIKTKEKGYCAGLVNAPMSLGKHQSYEDALEAGLQFALGTLKDIKSNEP